MRLNVDQFKEYLIRYKANFAKLYRNERWIRYHQCYCGFDIETTTIRDRSFMYVWQFGFKTPTMEQVVVTGRTWDDFRRLLKILNKRLGLRDNTRIIIWIANASYEFQFIRKMLNVDELFAKTDRNPLYFRDGGIEFREALSISQGNLEYLAKTWTTTQKRVGDLDYTIIRNSQTPLSEEKEWKYCENDVIILSEFAEKIFTEYIIPQKYIPMTSTGILRHDLRKLAVKDDEHPERLYEWIKSLFPKTKADYIYIMEWLFRGGFVHACFKIVGMTLYGYDSFDFKSSYPFWAFNGYYPVSPFKEIDCYNEQQLDELCNDFCVIFQVTLHDVKAKTNHSIESVSKCIRLSREKVIDNGRVHSCEYMTVFLTELDWESYKEFYEWDTTKTEIHSVEIAIRGELPKYLLDSFYKWFAIKESIDKHKNPQEYEITKTRVNGHFGLCVTRLCFFDVAYFYDDWQPLQEVSKSYDDMIEKQVLSPFWGIWITAHARRAELSLLFKMQHAVAYSDTDSHKLKLDDICRKVIKEWNEYAKAQIRAICDKYGYDFNVLGKLGQFTQETSPEEKGIMKRFKTLGAKRYICEYENEGFESTISGLKKDSLDKYCADEKIDPFYAFENEMEIPEKYTGKLTPIYIDDKYSEIVTDDYGNTEKMVELSGVYLKPVTFKLSMDRDYLKLISIQLERMIRHAN